MPAARSWAPAFSPRPGRRALRDVALLHSENLGGPARAENAVSLLDETLQEEKQTDALLSSLAESSVNQEAA
jgi:Domain of unknown function (DUF892)